MKGRQTLTNVSNSEGGPKDVVTISSKAAVKLREQLIHKCFQAGIGFRVLVSTDKSGKATLSIRLDRQHQRDKVIDSGGLKVLLDPSSATQISDYQLDYRDKPEGGFFFKTTREAKNG